MLLRIFIASSFFEKIDFSFVGSHYFLLKSLATEKTFSNQQWIILIGAIFFLSLLIVTFLQIKSKKRLKKAYKRIKEDADFIAEQNEEIRVQFNLIKQKNVELNKYRAHLEHLNKNKTERLKVAVEKAKESERLKSNLLSNIYHEIRTPLNAIIGFTQLLNLEEDIENKKYLNIIEKSADDLLLLVDNVIELSKLQAEKNAGLVNEIKTGDFLQKLYEETLSIKDELKKDELDIKLSISKECENGIFYSDGEKIYKILKQLLDNAFKYTSKGFIDLGCFKNGDSLHFYVKDSGIGIERGKLSTVFDAFQKVEDRNNLRRGVGVGLTIAKNMAESLGGVIEAESEYKKGTKFTLIIPDWDKKSRNEKDVEQKNFLCYT